ncbi:hypothetical protein AB0K48_30980, partial [Nonomuraea sp. NPDC055795]
FRYAVTSEAGAEARRLGARAAAGLTEPFIGVLTTGADTAAHEYVRVDHPDVLVTSLGRSADGLVVRLQSLAPRPVEARVTLPGLRAAQVSSGLLTDLAPAAVDGESVKVVLPACGVAAVWGTCEDR